MDKQFTPAEVRNLQELVLEVLNVCNYDDTGVTDDLGELAEVAAEILGITKTIRYEDEPDET